MFQSWSQLSGGFDRVQGVLKWYVVGKIDGSKTQLVEVGEGACLQVMKGHIVKNHVETMLGVDTTSGGVCNVVCVHIYWPAVRNFGGVGGSHSFPGGGDKVLGCSTTWETKEEL